VTGFEVAPEQLRAGGASIGGAAKAFAGRVEQLSAELASFEGGFGDDTIGMLVGTAYEAVSQWAFQCFQEAADDLLDAADDLVLMADDYDEVDQNALTVLQGLHGRLDRG
jgi:hypothetical protein